MKFQDEPTIFRELFGDTPKIRVLEYLLEGRELDHSIGDIAEGAGINRITLFRLWPKIEKSKLLEMIVTDTIPLKQETKKLKVISVAELFASVIDKVLSHESISAHFIM